MVTKEAFDRVREEDKRKAVAKAVSQKFTWLGMLGSVAFWWGLAFANAVLWAFGVGPEDHSRLYLPFIIAYLGEIRLSIERLREEK